MAAAVVQSQLHERWSLSALYVMSSYMQQTIFIQFRVLCIRCCEYHCQQLMGVSVQWNWLTGLPDSGPVM